MKHLFFILIFLPEFILAQSFYNVRDFGAGGDSSVNSTQQIQAAIDQCNEEGGGWVFFPPGNYLSGTIILKSNVSLYLESGATLYASRDSAHYVEDYTTNTVAPRSPVLLFAENAENIGIEGNGEINGQAVREWDASRGVDGFIEEETRIAKEAGVDLSRFYKVPPVVNLIYFVSCHNVKFQHVRLIESSSWTLHLQWCRNVFIDKVYIYSDLEAGVNADGLDIDGCKNVVVSNCIIETGDDAIVLKTTNFNGKSESCENVTVSNCVLTSTSAALKLGTESFADFRYITFDNCVIRNTNRGLGIIVRDGATVSDVNFSNIVMECDRKHYHWWGDGDPIWLVLLRRNPDSKLGMIKNVVIENITATGQGTSKIEGHPERNLENITLRNVKIKMNAEDKPDKRAQQALFAHHIDNLSLKGLDIAWETTRKEKKWAEAIKIENVNNFGINQATGIPGQIDQDLAFLNIQNSNNAVIQNIEATGNIPLLIRISGKSSGNLVLDDINQLRLAAKSYIVDEEVNKNEITIQP